MNTYWGDMHTHTFCGGGTWRTIEEAAVTAKEHLDFWAPGEHTGSDGPGPPPAVNFQDTWPQMRRMWSSWVIGWTGCSTPSN